MFGSCHNAVYREQATSYSLCGTPHIKIPICPLMPNRTLELAKMSSEQHAQYHRDYAYMVRADEYALRHIAAHLHSAQQYENLYKLLVANKAWMDAKIARFGSHHDYEADLNLAISGFIDPLTADNVLILMQLWSAIDIVKTKGYGFNDDDLRTLIWFHYRTENMSESCGMFERLPHRLRRQNRRHEEAWWDLDGVLEAAREQAQTQPKQAQVAPILPMQPFQPAVAHGTHAEIHQPQIGQARGDQQTR